MLYRPRKIQYVQAYKFKSLQASDKYMLDYFGIDNPPSISGFCQCGRPVSEHGFFNNQLLCPNVYVVYEGRTVTNVMSAKNFESIYVPFFDEDEDVTEEVNAKERKRHKK